jgi:uncharacterized membrane protein
VAHLYLAVVLALVLINLTALAAVGTRYAPAPLAKFGSVLALAILLYATEHFVGLGSLFWLWPIITLASLYVLRRFASTVRSNLRSEAVFLGCLGYALIWRLVDANLDPLGEAITDLYFISNFTGGETLPPGDRWLGGEQPFDFYYGFQFYFGALLGRLFGLSPGFTLNLAGALSYAFLGSLAWFAVSCHVRSGWVVALLVATLLIGGNGLSPLTLFAIHHPAESLSEVAASGAEQIWASTRFSGLYESRVNTDFGRSFLDLSSGVQAQAMDLPLETPAYLLLLGDFHPPIGSWILLVFSLALFNWITTLETRHQQPRALYLPTAFIAAIPWITLATNAWVFPLQTALSLVLLGLLALRRSLNLHAALAGTIMSLALLHPFLGYFSARALELPLMWVPEAMHTRWPIWVGLHWPTVLLLGLAAVRSLSRRTVELRDALVLGAIAAVFLIASEILFLDDPHGGSHERFNTVLKIWSWLWPFALLSLAPRLWSEGTSRTKLMLTLMCSALLLNTWNVVRVLGYSDIPGGSRFSGDGWVRRDNAHDDLLRSLSNAPTGVVLERSQSGAYDAAPAFALFSGKPAAIGWSQHQELWLGASRSVGAEARAAHQFYAGTLPEAVVWLRRRKVRYIVWSRRDEKALPGMRQRLDHQISSEFEFRSFEVDGDRRVGYWERRP